MSQTKIPGIYNYCDRWCERCTMTHACLLYENEQAAIAANPDIKNMDNPAFWGHISDQFKKAKEVLLQEVEKRGIELDLDNLDEIEYDFEAEREAQDASPFIQLAEVYWKSARDWVKSHGKMLREEAIQKIELNVPGAEEQVTQTADALDVISWYLFQLEPKLRRAHSAIYKPTDEFEQSDGLGSAKVALIGIERAMGAWQILYNQLPEQQNVIVEFLALLQKTRREVLTALPKALEFVRPGFDD